MASYDSGEASLTLALSVWSYLDERPLPGETIAAQEQRMAASINAAMAASAYSTWAVGWGPRLDPDRSNMMYIAKDSASDRYAVVVRGTDWSFVLDWLEDFASVLPMVPYQPFADRGAKVALGTSIGLDLLTRMDPVSYLDQGAAGATILVTGHSLGGCLASVLAPYLAQNLANAGPMRVYTYAAPSAGNAAFATAYNQLFDPSGGSPSAFRFYDTLDVVPNAWATLATIETYYPPLLPCSQDLIDLVNRVRDWLNQLGDQYVQVGDAADGTAIALPGHFLFPSLTSAAPPAPTSAAADAPMLTASFHPIGDLLFLLEAGLQHAGTNYQSLLQVEPVSAQLAKIRGAALRLRDGMAVD